MSRSLSGQSGSLTLSSTSGTAGGTAILNLSLASAAGNSPAGIQWTLMYDPGSITGITVAAGPAALAAGKAVQCAGGAGSLICVLTGLNANAIQDGVVATVNATLSGSASGLVSVGNSNDLAASQAGRALTVSGSAGAVSVIPVAPPSTPSVISLVCNPSVLAPGSQSTCTVILDQTPSPRAATIAVSMSSTALNGPATVTVPVGNLTVDFTVKAGSPATDTTVSVIASLNSSSQQFLLKATGTGPPPPPPTPVPTITGIPAGVLDAAAYTPHVAQGGILVIKGANLCPDGFKQAVNYPLADNLNGVSIAFTPAGGGASVKPYLIYTYGTQGTSQVAAVLPSATAPGSYNVTVTANGVTSAAVPATVVPRKFGLFTADSSGSGAAALQTVDSAGSYRYNHFTTRQLSGNSIAPAHPGDYVVVYGTGLGGVAVSDQSAPGAIDLSGQASVEIMVGGETIAPLYAGRSPNYPGMDQINLQLPADVATGCTVAIEVNVDGQPSNHATMAIAPAGSDICSPAPVSADILSRLDQGGSLTLGNFWLTQWTSSAQMPMAGLANVNESAFGSFVKYPGSQLASAAQFLKPAARTCQVSRVVGNTTQLVYGPTGTYLDAGSLTLAGPGISSRQLTEDSASQTYSLALGAGGATSSALHLPLGFGSFNLVPTIAPGGYQLTGSGGKDVGQFSASVTVGQPLTVPGGLPMSVDRSTDLTLLWSGGNRGDLVSVTGISGTIIGGTGAIPVYDAGRLTCTAAASDGSITIPAALLGQLPVTPAGGSGMGYLGIASGPPLVPGKSAFTAPLTAGGNIDDGYFVGQLGVFATTSYQ